MKVTEKNFNSVLEKMQKTCNKYRMLKFYRVYDMNMKEKKDYRRNPFGFYDRLKLNRDGHLITLEKEFFYKNIYLRVEKHPFRQDVENGKETYGAKYIYPNSKPLIHIDLGAGRALVIHEGDIIRFIPFGGFIVWDNHENDYASNISKMYFKYIFFPDFIKGRILNLESENIDRDMELEQEARLYEEWENEPI